MFRIFTKQKMPKEIFNVNMAKEDIEQYNIDIWVDHKDLNQEDYVVIYRKEPFLAPIYDKGEIREASKEEKIELGYDYELEDGEKVEDGKLVKVPQPSELYRPIWDKESGTWKEGASVDEVYDARELKVLEIMDLSEKIERLEKAAKISPILASPKTIERRKKDMAKLEQEVIELTALIEKLEK